MDKIVISGGGTGGHIYPAIAIANELRSLNPKLDIIFIGGKERLEAKIIPRYNFPFVAIPAEGFPRGLTLRWFKVIIKVLSGFINSIALLKQLKPKVVIGTGGYVCGPVLLGAVLLGIPAVIQEQNTVPGLTNRILGRFVDEIHIAFEEAAKYFKPERTLLIGNPIRREIANAKGDYGKLGLNDAMLTIFVLGGSQGASRFSVAMMGALPLLEPFAHKIQIVHQARDDDIDEVKAQYASSNITNLVQPFFNNIHEIYSLTDLMVCRAGAMTLAEVTASGLPAIVVPYPYATADHQTKNAQAMQQNGAAILIKDEELTGERLAETIISLLEDEKTLAQMADASRKLGKPDATERIAKAVLNLAKR